MDFKKLAPWNWFKTEEEETGHAVPVQHTEQIQPYGQIYAPVGQLHREVDQLFNNFLRGFGLSPLRLGSLLSTPLTEGLLKPTLDIGANDKEYAISVEVPGVDQQDIKLEITNNTLIIRGEKKQQKEEKGKDYYRIERSYGSFQRVLSLPEDADQGKVKATFRNGVLTVTMPRKALPQSAVKQIEIK